MLFKPTIKLKSVLEIDENLLTKHGIKGLILDLDNTLSMHGNEDPEEGVLDWLAQMKKLDLKLVIVSNNTRKRVEPLARILDLPFYHRGLKPLTIAFTKVQKEFNIPKKQIAVVGDQLFTDILGGNIKGMQTILVEPFEIEKGYFFLFKRKVEDLLKGK